MSPPPPDAHAPYAPRFLYGPHTARMDTVIVVRPGTKFVLSNFGGSIAIRTWPKDAVRVQAAYSRRARVSVRLQDGTLRVSSDSREGPPSPVGYMLTMPAWLPVSLSGVYNDVSVDGLQKGVSVETVRGDIVVRRAAGVIALRSVEGAVDVVDTRGSIAASSVNEAVRIAQSAGSVAAEAVNGDIHLLDLNSKDVEATTVNGGVIYDGRILDGGMYRFTTHSGDIALGLAESANATVSVSTFSGDFASAFAIQPRRAGRGRRFNFVLGNGKAQVDLESFQGSIELLRPGGAELRARVAEAWREHERDFARAFGKEWRWELKGDKADPDPDPNPLPDEDDGGN
jgi:hypothetical protein